MASRSPNAYSSPMNEPSGPALVDVLVVGSGPTGLTAACEARRHGFSVRLIESRATRATTSKALVLHARTMEVFESLGCAEQLVRSGRRFRKLHVRTSLNEPPRSIDLIDRSWGDTRYPYWLSIPQYETEKELETRLSYLGGNIEWSTQLVSLQDRSDETVATIRDSTDRLTTQRARWILGCDGGRSTVRDQIGVVMKRRKVGATFALADVRVASSVPEDEGHVSLTDDGLLLVVPMPDPGLWRLIAQISPDRPTLTAGDWEGLTRQRGGPGFDVTAVGWNSRFELTSGVASRIRRGRVFLLGDAAHVHSPVGGQGLNTGVQDAHNLVWKLDLARHPDLRAVERERLLDSYDAERRPTAQRMVRTTAVATRVLTANGRFVGRVLRSIIRLALGRPKLQDRLGRGVGMLDLRTAGASLLENPQVADGRRLHDYIDPLSPTVLRWRDQLVFVRPDRIVAKSGAIPRRLFTPPIEVVSSSPPSP